MIVTTEDEVLMFLVHLQLDDISRISLQVLILLQLHQILPATIVAVSTSTSWLMPAITPKSINFDDFRYLTDPFFSCLFNLLKDRIISISGSNRCFSLYVQPSAFVVGTVITMFYLILFLCVDAR